MFGQLGNDSQLTSHVPVEITDKFDSEVVQISSGGYHTLALTGTNKVYAWGKMNHGQLGRKWTKSMEKFVKIPIPVDMPTKSKVKKVAAGSLYSMALVAEE